MRIRPLRVAAWLLVLLAAAVLWAHVVPFPRSGRLDAARPFTQLTATRGPLVVLALLAGLGWLAVARRRRRGAGGVLPPLVLLVAAVAAAVGIAPRALSRADPAPRAPGVTVLTANLLYSEVRPATLVDLVRRTDADVLTLPETDGRLARRIARALAAARGEDWRAWTGGDVTRTSGRSAAPTSLVARTALEPRRLAAPRTAPRAHGQVRVELGRLAAPDGSAVEGPGPRIAAVHPLPPWPAASQADWRRDVRALDVLCRRGWLVGGDLNATIDHSPLRSVLAAGCTDAAAATGQGLRPTWSGGALHAVRPAIDHVLTSGVWRPVASGVLAIPGSDHRAVWARVVRRSGD